jgi:hypothetical protein
LKGSSRTNTLGLWLTAPMTTSRMERFDMSRRWSCRQTKTPAFCLPERLSPVISRPYVRIAPAKGFNAPWMTWSVELLPAPCGPSRPMIWPPRTRTERGPKIRLPCLKLTSSRVRAQPFADAPRICVAVPLALIVLRANAAHHWRRASEVRLVN